jgi:hypothetical protein
MDIEILTLECSGPEEHSDGDSTKKPKPISVQPDPDTVADDIDKSMTAAPARYVSFILFQSCFTSVVVRPRLLSCISDSNGRLILLGVFTSIVMVIGILIVYYTSAKPPGMFFSGYLYI